jgi:hypothetical protein
MAATQTASVANNVVALNRESTATLALDDLLNYNPLVKREELQKVAPYFNDIDILKALEITNKVQVTEEISYRVYEEGPWFRPVTPLTITGQTTAGTTGGTVSMTLTTGSYSTRSNGATTGTSSLYTSLMKNDVFRTYNGLTGFVQDKQGSGVTTNFIIERAAGNNGDLAAALNYHASNNIPISVLYNLFAEGSIQPLEGLSRTNVFHVNQVGILKTHRAATGTANTMKLITTRGAERPIETQKVEMGIEHRIKEAMLLWWGTGENWTDPSEPHKIVKSTKGVDGSIREMGNIYQYSTTTGYTEADFDAQIAQLQSVRGGNEFMVYCGSQMYKYLQAIIKTKIAGLPQANYTFQSFGQSDGKKKAIEIGFNTFIVDGITLHLIKSDIFNVPDMTNILGYNYAYMAYWVPGEMQVVDGDFIQNGNKVTRTAIPAMAAVYTAKGGVGEDGGMRRYKYWPRPVEITNRDEDQQEMLTEVGAKLSMLRKYALTIGV